MGLSNQGLFCDNEFMNAKSPAGPNPQKTQTPIAQTISRLPRFSPSDNAWSAGSALKTLLTFPQTAVDAGSQAAYLAGHAANASAQTLCAHAMYQLAGVADKIFRLSDTLMANASDAVSETGNSQPGAMGKAAEFGAKVAVEAFPLITAVASMASHKGFVPTPMDNVSINSSGLAFPDAVRLGAHAHHAEAKDSWRKLNSWRLGKNIESPATPAVVCSLNKPKT